MNTRIRPLVLVTLAAFCLVLCPRGILAQNRPADLVRNLPSLATTSLDRFHLDVYGHGMEGPRSGPTQVLLDGLPVAHSFLGTTAWNALPFATAAADSIWWDSEWFDLPGRARSDGTIRIRTKRTPGRHLYASFSALNETGDPGPERFRQTTDRNVDRSGPAMELLASSTGPTLHLEAGYRFDEHHMTDPAVADRVWSSYNGRDRPRVRIHSPWIRVDAAPAAWKFAGLAHGRLQRDFRFIPEFGREWPTTEEEYAGIMQAERRLDDRWDTGLHAWGRDMSVSSRPLRIEAPDHIRVREAGGHVWVRRCDERRCWRMAVGLRGTETTAGAVDPRTFIPSARLDVTSSDVDAAVMLFTESSSPQSAAPLSASGSLTLHMVTTRTLALSIRTHAERSSGQGDLSFLSLWREGVDFGGFLPDEPYVGITSDPGFSTRLQRIEVGTDVTIGHIPGLAGRIVHRARLSAAFRDTKGLTATLRRDQARERRRFFHRESRIATGIEGRAVSASAHVTGAQGLSLWYRYHRMISRGNVPWWQATGGLAPHTLGMAASSRLVHRIRFSVFVSAASPHIHPDRSDAPLAHRPWLVRSEISLDKRFLGDAAVAALSLLNVPNAPLTLHPDAGDEQLAARIQVTLRL
ncbi:MAG: hypothetical protein COV99_06010 [Bacteroidetes bacterium CG12_big_fil_rev_8_21_14_0_65_60_17]|nr:MAG: hypothetical protein COV99_06010 [Bacteroidetes bacterium CG12_big_fil_rev_8_21_14_0_65_60_17]